jgi:CO/xanthine dehydrogenase FAD-binding subunit
VSGPELARPETLTELVALRAAHPDRTLVAGGTDVMVGVNFGRLRPTGVIDVGRVAELRSHEVVDGVLRIGAGVTFGRIEASLAEVVPALATAARGVGSPQIRAAATIGGNLGTASPAGDAHPALIALDASIELASVDGTRIVPADGYFLGPGRSVRTEREVVTAVRIPVGDGMRQEFAKIGTRNAMVIAVAAVAVVVDLQRRRIGVGLGSVGPTPIRATSAEALLADALWPGGGALMPPTAEVIAAFAEEARRSARPIDDVRGTAAYRAHAVQVMARRCATWCLEEVR